MARSQFSYTVVAADVANTAGIGAPIKALENVEYNVYSVDSSGNRVTTIGQRPATYASRTSNTDLGYSGTTDADGIISFWLDSGEYEIEIEDTETPARISARTITWSSLAATDGSISGDYVSNDAQLDLPTLDDGIVRQLVPIGAVLDWWRPANSNMSVPSGFVICDGSQYSSSQHDFAGGGTITVPDLRNKFILGASISKNDNAEATAGVAGTLEADPTNAPGIGGRGGTNAVRNLTHTHTVQGHYHGRGTLAITGDGGHSHTHNLGTSEAGSHFHGVQNVIVVGGTGWSVSFGSNGSLGQFTSTEPNHTHTITGGVTGAGTHNHGTSGSIGATNSDRDGDSGFSTTDATGNIVNNHDFRPSYYGLLKIIKIKRA